MHLYRLRKPNSLKRQTLILVCLAFLCAQQATIEHDLEHPFHPHQNSCDQFFTHGAHGLALTGMALPLIVFQPEGILSQTFISSILCPPTSSHSIRAPPR
ncbi:MAG TPA: hypothetical protein DCZ03_13050 [Gammaproteobacteria bacterium]|nr:hypothetical protein [Gammaproteobacteria bacterium]